MMIKKATLPSPLVEKSIDNEMDTKDTLIGKKVIIPKLKFGFGDGKAPQEPEKNGGNASVGTLGGIFGLLALSKQKEPSPT